VFSADPLSPLWLGITVAAAILDHGVFLGLVIGDRLGLIDYSGWIFWTLLLALASCAVRLRDVSKHLPRLLIEPVLLLHMLQAVVLYHAMEWEQRRVNSFLVFVEGLMCITILCSDVAILMASCYRMYLISQLQRALKKVVERQKPPEVERFEYTSPDDGESQTTTTCIICLEEFDHGAPMARLACQHAFHAKCLDPWLQSHNGAPWCPYRCPPGFIARPSLTTEPGQVSENSRAEDASLNEASVAEP